MLFIIVHFSYFPSYYGRPYVVMGRLLYFAGVVFIFFIYPVTDREL